MELVKNWYSKYSREVLPHEELNELVLKAQKGDMEARNKIIEHNLGLMIRSTFRRLGTTYGLATIELDDIFQESTFGIIRAIELFDVSRGFAFSTYAQHWIDQSIERYICNYHSLIRIPVYVSGLQREFAKVKMEHEGRDEDFYINLVAFENDKSPESVRATLSYIPKISTMEGTKEDDEGEEQVNQFEDLTCQFDSEPMDIEIVKKIAKLLPKLDRKVLMLRMENYSLWAISEIIGCTRENVRLIQKRALFKLRAMVNRKEYLWKVHNY